MSSSGNAHSEQHHDRNRIDHVTNSSDTVSRSPIPTSLASRTKSMRSFWSDLERNGSQQSPPMPQSPASFRASSPSKLGDNSFRLDQSPTLPRGFATSPAFSESSFTGTSSPHIPSSDSPERKSSLARKGSLSRMQGPRLPGSPTKLKKVVTFESTHEVIQYETQTPEISSASDIFEKSDSGYGYDDDDDDSVNVPVIEPYDYALDPDVSSQPHSSRPLPSLPDNASPEINGGFFSPETGYGSDRREENKPSLQLAPKQQLPDPIPSPALEDQFRDTMPYHSEPSPAISMTSDDESDVATFGPDGKLTAGSALSRKESLLDSQRKISTEYVASVPYATEPSPAMIQRSMSQKRRSLNVALEHAGKTQTESIQEEEEPSPYPATKIASPVPNRASEIKENNPPSLHINYQPEEVEASGDSIEHLRFTVSKTKEFNAGELVDHFQAPASKRSGSSNEVPEDIPTNDSSSDNATDDIERGNTASSNQQSPYTTIPKLDYLDELGTSNLTTDEFLTRQTVPSLPPSLPEIGTNSGPSPLLVLSSPGQAGVFEVDHSSESLANDTGSTPVQISAIETTKTYRAVPRNSRSYDEEAPEVSVTGGSASGAETNTDAPNASKSSSLSNDAEEPKNIISSPVSPKIKTEPTSSAPRLATQSPSPGQLFNFEPLTAVRSTDTSSNSTSNKSTSDIPEQHEITPSVEASNNTISNGTPDVLTADITAREVRKTPALPAMETLSPFKFSPADSERSTFTSAAPTPSVDAMLASSGFAQGSYYTNSEHILNDVSTAHELDISVSEYHHLQENDNLELATPQNTTISDELNLEKSVKQEPPSPQEPLVSHFSTSHNQDQGSSPEVLESPIKSEEYASLLWNEVSPEEPKSQAIDSAQKYDSMLDLPQVSDDFMEGFSDILEETGDISIPLGDDGREEGSETDKYGTLNKGQENKSTIRSSSGSKARPSLTPEDVEKITTSKGAEETDSNRHILYELSKRPIPVPLLSLPEEDTFFDNRESLFLDDLNDELDKILGVEKKKGYTVRQHEVTYVATRIASGGPENGRRVSGPVKSLAGLPTSSAHKAPTISKSLPEELETGRLEEDLINSGVKDENESPTNAQTDIRKGPIIADKPQSDNRHSVLQHTENPMPDIERGRLFVRVVSMKDVELPNVAGKNANFNLTLDNGIHCITTENRSLSKTSSALDEEFELTVGDELEFIFTLKAKWNRSSKIARKPVVTTPVPVKQISPAKKLDLPKKHGFARLFGGSKRVASNSSTSTTTWASQTQQTNNSKPHYDEVAEPDSWDGLVAADGSFARAYIDFRQYEKEVYGNPATFELACFNEWAKQPGSKQRKPPYRIGKLQVQMMFIPRASKKEFLPRSIQEAVDELKAAKKNDPIHMEGYLSQLGGDCKYWRRRFFVLDGVSLIAHSETSKKARAAINLAKANRIVVERSALTQPVIVVGKSRRKSAFAEQEDAYSYVEEGFRIRFANGEIIDFYADDKESKKSWLDCLEKVIGNSALIQSPWIDMVLKKTDAKT